MAEQLALSQIMPISGDTVILGSSATPFLLSNVAQLQELAEYVNDGNADFNAAHYKLTQDVSLASVANWTAIGNYTNSSNNNPFKGTFDGDGHVISNMTIDKTTTNSQGLFGYTENATIENLGIEHCSVAGGSYVGALVGYANTSSSISHCYATGAVSGTSNYVGGLVGCANTLTTISHSYATGAVSGTISAGGLVGYTYNYSKIANCYATGAVSGTERLGGLVGNVISSSTIENCYATGAVSGTSYVGGLVGYIGSSTIQNCVALNPSVTGTSNVNRVVGYISYQILTDNYAWDGMLVKNVEVTDGTLDNKNGLDLTYSSGLSKQFLDIFGNGSAWDFADDKLPTLKDVGGNQSNALPSYMNVTTIEISTVTQLKNLATEVNNGDNKSGKTYTLMNDLDFYGEDWIPIGTNYSISFRGTFDGNGYVIKNLSVNNSSSEYQGFFGFIYFATIKNLGIEDCSVTGDSYVGGLTGNSWNSTVTNCYVTGNITGTRFSIGGLFGTAVDTTITNCYSAVEAEGYSMIGGLIGKAQTTLMENCFTTGTVSGEMNVGGLVGQSVLSSEIKNSVALNESITSNRTSVARILGLNNNYSDQLSTLTNNYAWSGMTVTGDSGTADADTEWGADLTYSSGTLDTQFSTIFGNNSAWTYSENGLPILKNVGGNQSSALPSYISTDPVVVTPPTEIYTVADLQALATWVNGGGDTTGKTYTLMNDLDLSGVEWEAIGTSSSYTFKGEFDGDGKVISNLTITNDESNQGLFGCTNEAEIKNLGIENGNVTGGGFLGALVGFAYTTTIEKCYSTGAVSGTSGYVGGLVGATNKSSTISNCYSTGAVSGGTYVGGLVGSFNDSDLHNCYATGAVTGSGDSVGGLVGTFTTSSTISNCYATGVVSGGTYVGGLAGRSSLSTIQNSLALNPSITGTQTYSLGRVVGLNAGGNLTNNYAWKDMLVDGSKVTDGAENDKNGDDCLVIDGVFAKSDGKSIYEDTSIFDPVIWTIPSATDGDYMLLPTLIGVGNDVPSIYLVQTILSEVTITFSDNGADTAVPRQETVGNIVSSLPIPTKSKASFEGWFLDDTFTTKVTTSTVFKLDTTVYAKWLLIPTETDFDFITPSDLVYDGNEKVAKVTAKSSLSSTLTGTVTVYYTGINGTSYAKSDTAPSAVGEYQVSIDVEALGDYGAGKDITDGTWIVEITQKPLADSMISTISDQTYTGTALTPSVTVTDGGILTENQDYTVAYSAHTNAGQASVEITGKGNYSGTVTVNFTITQATISSLDLGNDVVAPVKGAIPHVSAISDDQYTGTISWNTSDNPFASNTVYSATVTLAPTSNYTLTGVVANSFAHSEATSVENSADSGTVTLVFPATAEKSLLSIAITAAPTNISYVFGENFDKTAMEITAYYDDNTTKVVTDDCTFTGDTNLQVGTTSVQASYTDGITKTVDVEITVDEATLTADHFTYTAPTDLVYSGTGKVASAKANGGLLAPNGEVTVYYEGVSPTIYTKSTTAPTDVGTYQVKIDVATDGNFKAGTNISDQAWVFEITVKSLKNDDFPSLNYQYDVSEGSVSFIEPSFEYFSGEIVTGDMDYSYSGLSNLSYADLQTELNKLADGDSATVTYTMTLNGNYTGRITGQIDLIITDIVISGVDSDTVKISTNPSYGDDLDDIFTVDELDLTAVDRNGDPISGEFVILVNGTRYTGSDILKPGDYVWEFVFRPTDDSGDISLLAGTFTLSPLTVSLTWTDTNLFYNGDILCPIATISNKIGDDVVEVTVTGGQTDVGDYTATATTLTGTDSGNYVLNSGESITFSIRNPSDSGDSGEDNSTGNGGYVSGTLTTPSVSVSDGGTISLTPKQAVNGKKVTITILPETGYELESLWVKDSFGKEITVTKQEDGTYSYTQPLTKVTISVEFALISEPETEPETEPDLEPESEEKPQTGYFTDVGAQYWYYDVVYDICELGLMTGTKPTEFQPETSVTRGMIAQILYNLAEADTISHDSSFTDVPITMYYAIPVAWAEQNGVVSGYVDGTYRPENSITREELAVLFYAFDRKFNQKPLSGYESLQYSDNNMISPWAYEYVSWAVHQGLISGKLNDTIDPLGQAQRGELAQILLNYVAMKMN